MLGLNKRDFENFYAQRAAIEGVIHRIHAVTRTSGILLAKGNRRSHTPLATARPNDLQYNVMRNRCCIRRTRKSDVYVYSRLLPRGRVITRQSGRKSDVYTWLTDVANQHACRYHAYSGCDVVKGACSGLWQ